MGRRRGCTGVAVVAILVLGSCRRAATPAAPPASIVLVSIDTLRADHVTPAWMPHLTALTREAVVFQHAFTVAPLTLPAHASLLTGVYPPRHGVRDNHIFTLPEDVPGFPARLAARGYATAAFVSAVVLDHRYGLNRGFDVYDDVMTGPERPAAGTLARAQGWIDGRPQRPFFVWIHLFEPHAPYLTGSYEREVSAADEALGGFFGFLRARGLWDDLVLSVTSDHGESLGEHGEQTHGFFVYDSTLRIPWLLKAPRLAARTFSPLVRIVDELPTLIDLAGAGEAGTPAASGAVDGVSLAPALARSAPTPVDAYAETFLPRDQFGWSELRSIRMGDVKYIDAPQPELYDLHADPSERTNVIASRIEEAGRAKRRLDAVTRVTPAAPKRAGTDPVMSEKLMSLGYLGFAPSGASSTAVLADPKARIEVYNRTMASLELSEAGDLAGALRELDAAERLDPDVAQVSFLKGNLLGRLDRYPDAARALRRTLALNPTFVAARFKLALALLRSGRPDAAAAALERVVQDDPGDFRAWHNLAAIAYSGGDLDRAEQLERKALAISPEYAEAWNTLGAIYILRRQFGLAVEALSTAARLSPRNAQTFRNLSLALRSVGQPERAATAASTACSLDPRLCDRPSAR